MFHHMPCISIVYVPDYLIYIPCTSIVYVPDYVIYIVLNDVDDFQSSGPVV